MKTHDEKMQELLLEKLRIQNEILRCKLDREKDIIDFQNTICDNLAESITINDEDENECEPPEPIVVFERMERWIVAPYCPHCRAYMDRENKRYDRDSDMICDECGGYIKGGHNQIFDMRNFLNGKDAREWAKCNLPSGTLIKSRGKYRVENDN